MGLEMTTECEKCQANLEPHGEATICTHECTFCLNCAKEMLFNCPNCGGELVRRPRRKQGTE